MRILVMCTEEVLQSLKRNAKSRNGLLQCFMRRNTFIEIQEIGIVRYAKECK